MKTVTFYHSMICPRCHMAGLSLSSLLDDFPDNETVHAAIIARPYLSEAVIVRLVALVSQALSDSLISRHPLPERYRREVMNGRPGRPEWWARGLLNIGR